MTSPSALRDLLMAMASQRQSGKAVLGTSAGRFLSLLASGPPWHDPQRRRTWPDAQSPPDPPPHAQTMVTTRRFGPKSGPLSFSLRSFTLWAYQGNGRGELFAIRIGHCPQDLDLQKAGSTNSAFLFPARPTLHLHAKTHTARCEREECRFMSVAATVRFLGNKG